MSVVYKQNGWDIERLENENTPDWIGNPTVVIYSDALPPQPRPEPTSAELEDLKIVNNVFVELSAEEKQEKAQAKADAELEANRGRWTLENQYIQCNDQLRVALGIPATLTKLGYSELVPMMMTLRANDKDAYEYLRDMMAMINSALFRFNVLWWDSCVWHPEIV